LQEGGLSMLTLIWARKSLLGFMIIQMEGSCSQVVKEGIG
jgi:hypothetical protein